MNKSTTNMQDFKKKKMGKVLLKDLNNNVPYLGKIDLKNGNSAPKSI